MKHAVINDWARRALPVVVIVFLLLLLLYGWLLTMKYLPDMAAAFYPQIKAEGIKSYGEVGEMLGAVGSFFSGFTVFLILLLFWRYLGDQRNHRKDLLKIKSDYELNRINNLIISQVNRVEYLVESLTFQDLDGNEYEGAYGIDFLNAALNTQEISKFKNREAVGLEEEKLVLLNYKNIKRLLVAIAQSSQTIEDQIQISNTGWLERERLYAIYLRNLGASMLVLLRKLESFTHVIISSENSYQHTQVSFDNPIFILSELSAGFFHNIVSNCEGSLVDHIIPEPI